MSALRPEWIIFLTIFGNQFDVYHFRWRYFVLAVAIKESRFLAKIFCDRVKGYLKRYQLW